MKYILSLSLLVLVFSTPDFAQIGGTSTYDFLNLPVSARSAALGGNFIGVNDGDLSLAAQNPSFLQPSMNNQVVLTYTPLFAGIDYSYFSYARSITNIGTFDFSIKYIDYGVFTQADAAGDVIGTFSADEYMLNFGYGRSLLKDSLLSAGINAQFVSSRLDQYYSTGILFDLGVSYVSHSKLLYIGAVIDNIGTQIKDYIPGDNEPVPLDAHLGVSYKLPHAPFRFNIIFQHIQQWNLQYLDPVDTETVNPLTGQAITSSNNSFLDNLGRHLIGSVELLLGKNFALRFGYNYEMRKELEFVSEPGLAGISGGFEMKIYKFHINYALAKYTIAGSSNTFTLILKFSDFQTRKS